MPRTRDISGKLVFLGTGTSVGVPAIGCGCDTCTSSNPRNVRTRCGLVLGLPEGNLLIDTPPDLRTQLLREGIGIVHSVAFTHEHADHIFGLDDLRLFPFYLGHPVPLWCEETVEKRIRKSFDYAFDPSPNMHTGGVPQLEMHRITVNEPFELLGATILPLRLLHGPNFKVLGFRIGNIAYCTDTNSIPAESMAQLRDLDVLILDALRYTGHITHFSLQEAIEVAQELKPKRTLFTHMSHDVEYESASEKLPDTIQLAYDGLEVPLS